MSSPYIVTEDNSSILSTLLATLKGTTELQGVSVLYGEEEKWDVGYSLPMIVIYPKRVRYAPFTPGYVKDIDPNYKILWKRAEYLEIVLWAEAPNEGSAQDDADQVHILESKLLQAFYVLRANGYQFQPIDGQWAMFQNAKTRRGRAYIMNIMIDLPILSETPIYTTVTSVDITDVINDQ